MGLGELFGEVMTRYTADVSDHKAKLRELTGEEKKRAEAAVAQQERINKSVDDWKGKITAAAAAAGAAYMIAKASLEEFGNTVRLQGSVSAETMIRMRQAAGGLRSEMELLKLGQAGQQGAFKLTAAEMEKVVQGMRALEKKGFDTVEVTNKITKAIQEGAVTQLEEFGIKLESTGDIARDKQLVLESLADQVRDVGGNFDTAADGAKRAGVAWENTLHGVKMAIGELVTAMGPLLDALASSVGLVADVAQAAGKVPGGLGTIMRGFSYATGLGAGGRLALDAFGYASQPTEFASARGILFDNPALNQASTAEMKRRELESRHAAGLGDMTPAEAQAMAARAERERLVRQWGAVALGRLDWAGRALGEGLGFTTEAPRRGSGRGRSDFSFRGAGFSLGGLADLVGAGTGYLGQVSERQSALADVEQRRQREYEASLGNAAGVVDLFRRQQSMEGAFAIQGAVDQREGALAKVFGPVSEFDAYVEAFGLLESAVTSAFDAWITGSKSFGAAVKEAIAAGAAALAKEAIMQALRHTAYGIGSLAIGGPLAGASAASHFKAALVWGGVAAAAGITAKGLGGGGGSAAGGAGAYRPSAGGGTLGGSSHIVIIGDVAGDSSDRRKAREFRRFGELAARYAPPTGSQHG